MKLYGSVAGIKATERSTEQKIPIERKRFSPGKHTPVKNPKQSETDLCYQNIVYSGMYDGI